MGSNNEWSGYRSDKHDCDIAKSKIMSEFSTVTDLLDELKSEFQTSSQSPRRLILDQSISICGAYLDTLMHEERHNHLARSAHRNGLNLKQDLETSISLLDEHPYPDPPPDQAGGKQEFIESDEASKLTPRNDNKKAFVENTPNDLITDKDRVFLKIHFFGAFRAHLNGNEIITWPKGKSKQLFKYLASKGKTPTPKEVLMELFWPNHSSESARNNLNVAIYSLRQSLKKILTDTSFVLFKEGCYQINPKIKIWVDATQFCIHLNKASKLELHGKTPLAIEQLHQAEALYVGPLLPEDAYCDWVLELQNQACENYRSTLKRLDNYYRTIGDIETSIALNKKIVTLDNCDENSHHHLMENYSSLGRRHLALRQFKICKDSLKRNLDLYPQQNLIDLYQQIKNMRTA